MKPPPSRPAALLSILLGLWLGQSASAVPGYDAHLLTGLPASASGALLSQFNNDGACAYAHYDDTAQVWVTGIWVPRPLYGYAAGYTPLSTFPGVFGVAGVWPMLDNAGNFIYYTTNGSTQVYGTSSGLISLGSVPHWNDANVVNRSFSFRGILGWATSDPAPYAGFEASVTTQDGNTFQPYFSNNYSGTLNGGLQILPRPSGDFGSVAELNRLGHQIWNVQDARTDLPGRVIDSNSTRYYVVNSAGATQIEQGYFMSGRGDVSFQTSTRPPGSLSPNTAYLLLAGPLGPLGPGMQRQADIPGMPPGWYISKFNSAGNMIVVKGLDPPRVLNAGKSALLSALLPPSVPRPRPLNQSNVTAINEAGMLSYIARENNGFGPQFLLTPTLDCDVALTGTQPYRIGGEFDLEVTVRNVAGAAVTEVRVEGNTPGASGISVTSFPSFDIIGGPVPATPLTLAAGASQVIRYRCRATRSGVGEVTAMVKGTAASGNALRCESTAAVEIELRGDLLLKRTDEAPALFALDNVYQKTAPLGAQDRRELIIAEGEVLSFDVKIQNDEGGPLALRVASLETGSTAIPAHYFQGTTDITDIIKADGWTTPVLAAGAHVLLRVDFGPTDGAIGGEVRTARLTLQPENGGASCDMVRMEAVNAPPINVTLRRPSKDGLTPESIAAGQAGNGINAPLVFTTNSSVLALQSQIKQGLVADGVTPLLLEMRVPPENLAGLPDGVTYNMALETAAGGSLDGAPAGERLRFLKDGRWQSVPRVTFTESQNVHFACITPVKSDDLQLTGGARELRLRLRFTQPGSGAFVTAKTVLVRRPPIALVHGYNTNGEWGSGFVNTLAMSRGQDFVKTIYYGQEPAGSADTSRENTVLPFAQLAPILEAEMETLRVQILAGGWAMTRHDVVAHSQGGVLTRMLCSWNPNAFLNLPFRNPGNFYRGRFNRVVTIGSPHNGTRLVRYMKHLWDRASLSPNSVNTGYPALVSGFMIGSGTSQEKFDPFGPAIRLLQSPDPAAPWYPDSGASFHLVQTTTNFGQIPTIGSATIAENALGLDINGAAVLPRGSDGVVDFDSMTATTPEAGQSPPANSYRMPGTQNISHALVLAGGVNIFGGDSGQVDSISAAQHIIGALDQSSSVPAPDRVFGPFRLPAPLPQSVDEAILAAAQLVTPGVLEAIGFAPGPSPREVVSKLCEFTLPPGEELAGPVTWIVGRYGEHGLTDEGVTLLPQGNPAQTSVRIDSSYWGDVVLYGTARTVSGLIITGRPFVVGSTVPDPALWELDYLEVEPAGGRYPVGAGIEPVLWETWRSLPDGNGEGGGETVRILRFPRSENMTVSAVPSYIMDVSDPLRWTATQPGRVVVTVTVQGVEARVPFTVFSQTTNGEDRDADGRSDSDEAAVPNRSGTGTGDGNGDRTPDVFQSQVTPVRGPAGTWFTLVTDSALPGFSGVTPQPPPADPAQLPESSAFDFGFVGFNVEVLNPGASTIVTVLLPPNHEVSNLWAWGPEPGLATPHWFEFLREGQTTGGVIQPDRILLYLTDGGPGDADGEANGVISVVPLGPARRIPPPPDLNFLSGPAPSLTWPASFPNRVRTILETSDDLRIWSFLPDSPQTTAGRNVLPVSPGLRGYFRLRGF